MEEKHRRVPIHFKRKRTVKVHNLFNRDFRIGVVKGDNDRLNKRLLELKMKRSDLEKKEKEITEPPKRELKKDHRLIPGLIKKMS